MAAKYASTVPAGPLADGVLAGPAELVALADGAAGKADDAGLAGARLGAVMPVLDDGEAPTAAPFALAPKTAAGQCACQPASARSAIAATAAMAARRSHGLRPEGSSASVVCQGAPTLGPRLRGRSGGDGGAVEDAGLGAACGLRGGCGRKAAGAVVSGAGNGPGPWLDAVVVSTSECRSVVLSRAPQWRQNCANWLLYCRQAEHHAVPPKERVTGNPSRQQRLPERLGPRNGRRPDHRVTGQVRELRQTCAVTLRFLRTG
jgi:hypothetical protein